MKSSHHLTQSSALIGSGDVEAISLEQQRMIGKSAGGAVKEGSAGASDGANLAAAIAGRKQCGRAAGGVQAGPRFSLEQAHPCGTREFVRQRTTRHPRSNHYEIESH